MSAGARGGRLQGTPPEAALARRRPRIAAASASLAPVSDLRIGIGIDAHAFEEGTPLVLGGVAIDHPRGLAGHSDGDVIAHALTDALLGAAGLADIGALFPSTTTPAAEPTHSSFWQRHIGRCARPASRSSTQTAS